MSTKVVVLLDQTGSMDGIKDDTIGGFNQFLSEQKKNDVKLSLTLFNSEEIEKRYVNEPIGKIKKLTEKNYRPSHMTPLYDAIGQTIADVIDEKKLLFVIITDGFENASKEYKKQAIKELIKKQEKSGWKFLYLGVGLTNFSDSENIGIFNNFTMNRGNVMGGMRGMSASVANYAKTDSVTYQEENE